MAVAGTYPVRCPRRMRCCAISARSRSAKSTTSSSPACRHPARCFPHPRRGRNQCGPGRCLDGPQPIILRGRNDGDRTADVVDQVPVAIQYGGSLHARGEAVLFQMGPIPATDIPYSFCMGRSCQSNAALQNMCTQRNDWAEERLSPGNAFPQHSGTGPDREIRAPAVHGLSGY